MQRKSYVCLLALVVVFALSTVSHATISDVLCLFPDDPGETSHDWNFPGPGGAIPERLWLGESISEMGNDSVYTLVSLDSGSIAPASTTVLTIVKDVTNDTAVDWTSYELELAALPGGMFNGYDLDSFDFDARFVSADAGPVPGSGDTTDYFQTDTVTDDLVVFEGVEMVEPGDTVRLTFQIEIDSTTGMFGWCIHQNPVPEPATIALLAIGGVLLRKRG